jgi:hypothetical protein
MPQSVSLIEPVARRRDLVKIFTAAALESEILKNQIDCCQPLMKRAGLAEASPFGASVPMLLQGGYGYGNILRLCTALPFERRL